MPRATLILSPWLIPRGFTCQSRAADQSLVFPGPLELSVPEDKGGPWVVASRHLSPLISRHRLKFSRAFSWETILTHITSSGGRAQGGCLETKIESRLCHGSPGASAHIPSCRASVSPREKCRWEFPSLVWLWGLPGRFAHRRCRASAGPLRNHQGARGESTQPRLRPERGPHGYSVASVPLRRLRDAGTCHLPVTTSPPCTLPPHTGSSLTVGI